MACQYEVGREAGSFERAPAPVVVDPDPDHVVLLQVGVVAERVSPLHPTLAGPEEIDVLGVSCSDVTFLKTQPLLPEHWAPF